MSSKMDKDVVAAIDFGTISSAYAFSFRRGDGKKWTDIYVNKSWLTSTMASKKVPTCILFQPNKDFHSYGYDAEDKYLELAEAGQHHDWYYFNRFKMALENKELKRGLKIDDNMGHEMPAKRVFAMAICYLKDRLLDELNNQSKLTVNDIHWVITVPAIWTDSAKQFMREAAIEGGINGCLLSIALEPEAAAIYCNGLSPEDFLDMVPLTDDKFMVIDLGGGTIDITVLEKQRDGTLKEIVKSSGGAWGATKIDDNFEKLIKQIVGDEVFRKFGESHIVDLLFLQRAFEERKRDYTRFEGLVTVRIPISLVEIYKKENPDERLEERINKMFPSKLFYNRDRLRIERTVFESQFDECILKIVELISELCKKPDVNGVGNFVMVGSFSDCPLVQKAIKSSFPAAKVIIPRDSGLAVLKGAILYGQEPHLISSRKAKYTYGINISPPFDSNVHPEVKAVTIGGIHRCKDVFKRYIEIGESIKLGESKTGKHVTIKPHQREMLLKIYVSTDRNPKFVTDPSCEMLGQLVVKLPDRADILQVQVRMIFGGTELMVEAEEGTNMAKFTSYFDFL